MSLRLSFSPIRRVVSASQTVNGPFVNYTESETGEKIISLPKAFGFYDMGTTSTPPIWLQNYFDKTLFAHPKTSFYKIPDFGPENGDIKAIWELSRFIWILDLAKEPKNAKIVNEWIADWLNVNPPYIGPNWKCGQEASIRVLHLLMGMHLLNQLSSPTAGFIDLIILHLRRIAPTVSYAMAQDNNHGISEAAALYIGGSWLASLGNEEGQKWSNMGRRLLENRVGRLIGEDGSFSQYSVTYHRLMLDSLSLVEWWRIGLDDKPFSKKFQKKSQVAARWLFRITDASSGDAPNIGANDGAHIVNLAKADYRDFRPSIAVAYALWHDETVFGDIESANIQLHFLNIKKPIKPASIPDGDPGMSGGFAVLKNLDSMTVLRHPRFRFRPSQGDILHLDFWLYGRNIFRDGGTYSYNTTLNNMDYFTSPKSHNTVEFDNRNQMPRLGRFLFAAWPKVINWSWKTNLVRAGYKDHKGASHIRTVKLASGNLEVLDQIKGFSKTATLRWRFDPDLFESLPDLSASKFRFEMKIGKNKMEITSTSPIELRWEIGYQSRYYFKKSRLPVLCILTRENADITTTFRWK